MGKFYKDVVNSFKHKSKFLAVMYVVLVIMVLMVMTAQFYVKRYENVFTCVLTLVLFLIPTIIDKRLKIDLPQTLEAIIVLFIFAAEILGEVSAFYIKLWWWDTLLHTLNGFLMAAIGFSLVDIFNQSDRFKFNLSPLFVAVVAFCFSMTIGVLWEFLEFSMDVFTKSDMQKDTIIHTIATIELQPDGKNLSVILSGIEDVILKGSNLMLDGKPVNGEYALGLGGYLDIGIMDTMKDLIVNFVGAVIFSVIGFFYIKNRGKGNFAKKFIPQIQHDDIENNEDLYSDK